MMTFEIRADISTAMTCEKFLRNHLGFSARFVRKIKHFPNAILRGDENLRTIDLVFPNDIITIVTEEKNDILPNGELHADIVFENDEFVVFNKPPDMPVHPSHNHRNDTLGNYFSYCYPGMTFRPVYRLDKDTSGACVIAKGQRAAASLQHKIKKVYYAVVMGSTPENGTYDDPIKRVDDSVIKRWVDKDGDKAVTNFKKLEGNDKYSFLEINLETGRTHQIRVHFASHDHPLFGDELYGGNKELISRQALHCGKIKIGKKEIKVPLPEDIENLLKIERRN